jgi:hypothetical protein
MAKAAKRGPGRPKNKPAQAKTATRKSAKPRAKKD